MRIVDEFYVDEVLNSKLKELCAINLQKSIGIWVKTIFIDMI